MQLCAALVFDPDILILDEPFSGLDPVAVDVMSRVLRDRADAGVPVLFSSHQLDLVERLCDRVAIIKEGSMVAVGSIDELRSRGGDRWQVDGRPASPTQAASRAARSMTAASQAWRPRTGIDIRLPQCEAARQE